MSLAAAKKKSKGTLHVALTGTGSYTVTGKGFRKTAQSSKSFKVAPGAYKVSAAGASVSRGTVKVKPGKKVTVTVVFPPAPVATPPPTVTPPTVTPPPIQTPPPSDPTTPPPPPPADTTPPGRVTGLTVGTRTTSSIALSWTNPGDPDLAEVIVRRALGATAPTAPNAGVGVALGTPKASSVTDNALTADAAYSYAVFTRDASNNTNPTPATVTTTTASGPIQRVSTSAAGTQANGYSDYPRWSPDGTQIVFTSDASNLVPGDTNAAEDVFVKTLATGAIQRVSTDAAGAQANEDATWGPRWSPDGTRIVFGSFASNMVPGDTNDTSDLFVKTLASGAVQRVSTDAAGTQANNGSDSPQWSPDGTQIAFTSYASNLVPGDTNGRADVIVKTLASGAVQRVSTDAAGTQANYDTWDGPQWSPDGTQIAFGTAASNLVAGDTNGAADVFVKTLATGAIQRVSTDAAGTQGNENEYSGGPWWSPDGTKIAFDSYASNLVPGDTNHSTDVFVKTLASGAVQRVSTDAAGAQVDGSSRDPRWSPDGTRIAFYSSAMNLVAGDSNGSVEDVFVKTVASGAVQRVSTDAAGTQGNEYSEDPQWSPDGTQIAFTSFASNLVPGDTNGVTDVFVKTLP